MDNQNTNGLGINETPNQNNNEMASPVNVAGEESSNTMPQAPLETPTPTETIEPIKPNLDSILNGNAETVSATENPVPAPTIETLENTEAINETSTIQNSIPTIDTLNNVAPQMPTESLTNDAVVDKSAETIATPTLEQPNIEQSTPLETTIVNPQPAPTVEQITPTTNESPTIETIEDAPVTNDAIAPQPTVVSNEQAEIKVEESPVVPPNDTSMPPLDDFNEVPTPPSMDESGKNKKKEKSKKTLITLLLILLVAAIGIGIYYFLTTARQTSETVINTKEVKVELGNALSHNIDDYAMISGYNKNECSLNLDNVNVEKVSTYKYTITCGKANVEGLVIVDDTTKPEVVTNDLIVALNTTLKPEEFIEECKDVSKCSYNFQTNVDDLTKNIGEYNVEIVVSDEYNNQNIVTAKLTVAQTAPARYLTCKKEAVLLEEIGANFVDAYRIGIDATDNFYNAVRISEFTFNNLDNYNKTVNDYKNTNTINSRSGDATFNEDKMSILLKENKTLEDMNNDLKGRLPNNSNILRAFLSGLGYICN